MPDTPHPAGYVPPSGPAAAQTATAQTSAAPSSAPQTASTETTAKPRAGSAQPGWRDAGKAPPQNGGALPPVVVKKYANRRLYNTESSSYVTLEDLAKMVRDGRDFVVYDAKSGDDITRSVLTQIIVEEEAKGTNLLPISFLRQLIGFYGDSLQSLVPRYLEVAMSGFARQQEQMRRSMEQAMGGFMPMPFDFSEVGKQNMAMMERAMSLFSPFRPTGAPSTMPTEPATTPSGPSALETLQAEMETLKRHLAEVERATVQKGNKES